MVMMKSDSLAVEISAGRGPVFDLLTSLEESPILKLKDKKAEVLSSPPVGIGTRWRETRMGVGKEAVVEVQITQFLPPKFVALQASTPNATYFLKVSLEDAAEGCVVRAEVTGKPKNLLSQMMSNMLVSAVKREVMSDLQALKRAVESGSAEPAKA